MEDYIECGPTFESNKAVLLYMKRTNDNDHAHDVCFSTFVLANNCPIYLSTFARVQTSRAHVATTLKTNRCVLDGGMLNETINEPDAFTCPGDGCEFEAASWKHLCMRTTTEHFGVFGASRPRAGFANQTYEHSLNEARRRAE